MSFSQEESHCFSCGRMSRRLIHRANVQTSNVLLASGNDLYGGQACQIQGQGKHLIPNVTFLQPFDTAINLACIQQHLTQVALAASANGLAQ